MHNLLGDVNDEGTCQSYILIVWGVNINALFLATRARRRELRLMKNPKPNLCSVANEQGSRGKKGETAPQEHVCKTVVRCIHAVSFH